MTLALLTRHPAGFELRFIYRERGRWVMGPAIVEPLEELLWLATEVLKADLASSAPMQPLDLDVHFSDRCSTDHCRRR